MVKMCINTRYYRNLNPLKDIGLFKTKIITLCIAGFVI